MQSAIAYIKLFHVIFVFTWVGSLLALTRLMGYQAKEEPGVQLRLARLYKRIYFLVDLPSMVLAVGLGILLLFLKHIDFKAPWFHMKMTFAALLIICDIVTGAKVSKLAKMPISGRGTGYKILHGLTALILIGVLFSIYILKQKI